MGLRHSVAKVVSRLPTGINHFDNWVKVYFTDGWHLQPTYVSSCYEACHKPVIDTSNMQQTVIGTSNTQPLVYDDLRLYVKVVSQ
jgi:hypothetical protein